MVLKLDEEWIWDSWYVHDGKRWHSYFLKADKSIGDPNQRHWHVSHGHATSENLIDWDYHGTCFAPSAGPAWDDCTTWTGSVVEGDDGLWHLFYTGSSKAEHHLYQRIGHATSRDLHVWERVGDGMCLDMVGPAAEHYQTEHGHTHDQARAMRDPWVMRDPNGDGWLMYFTAQASGIEERNEAGTVGFATSPDLNEWTLQPPVFTGEFGQLEVPQVLQLGDKWYCLFCTAGQHFSAEQAKKTKLVRGTHYLIGDDPRGPWQVAPGQFLDGEMPAYRYGARICETPEGPMIVGFRDGTPETFLGYMMDPEPIDIDKDGLLSVRQSANAAE